MSGLTITNLAQQVQDLLDKTKQQNTYLAAWLGGSANGGPNNDGRYPFLDLTGAEILVPAPAKLSDTATGPAAQAVAAMVAALASEQAALTSADRAEAQRVLSEAARGAAVEARNLAQEHRNHAGTSASDAEYWANLARTAGQRSADDREVVEQLAAETADNAALAAQDASDAAASAALAATFNPALYDLKSDTLAASRLTGVIDIARIPVLPSQLQFVSSGGLANLTAQQQQEIGRGSIVTTTDGFRYVYSGSGAKTVATSYTVLADITPAWDSVSDKPAYFPTNIANVAGLQSALDLKAPTANAVFTNAIAVMGSVGAHSFAANHSLFYPDGNHTVIKTGPGGAEKYWRFDTNGFLYSLNGGFHANQHIQTMTFFMAGESTVAPRTEVQKGWLEVRNQNGPYIDLSKDNATDFHARFQYQTDNFFVLSANGGRSLIAPSGRMEAHSPDGNQAGDLLTRHGTEQQVEKQITYLSRQNPQDGGAFATLEVRGEGGGYGAWMKFHRPGQYGTYFGMYEDGRWGFGGWSTGGMIHEFFTTKSLVPMRAYNDTWNASGEGYPRFYFASNGRSYYRSANGHEWRNSSDQNIGSVSNNGVLEVAAQAHIRGNDVNIYGGSPTLRFMDSDHRSAHIHVNSNRFYVLRGGGVGDSGWATLPGKGWPLEIDLETNHATFGGSIYLNSEWLRIHGQTGVYWETYAGGWYMSDTSWIRAYGNKGIYTAGQVRGGTVVGESDIRLKENVATISDATQKVEALTGVTFDWKRTGSAGMGFIAQDFEQVLPALVTEDTDGMKGVEYGPVVALLVEALKETNARVAALESGRV
nr:shufflon system plasmid conjugative transfer pilus tip adhesin PilV [Brevundimonas diminuta]